MCGNLKSVAKLIYFVFYLQSVLVETQDKALRRISELREQCSLEQQAKAHLESALRLEMDEMQCVIKTLTSKLSLLGENADTDALNNGQENLIHLDNVESTNLISLSVDNGNNEPDITNERIKQVEEMLEKYKEQVNEEKSKFIVKNEENRLMAIRLEELQKKITELTTEKEENSISLAENKMMIHFELENKEKEVRSLEQRLLVLEKSSKQSCDERDVLKQEKSKLDAQWQELVREKKNLENRLADMDKLNKSLEESLNEVKARIIVVESERDRSLSKHKDEMDKFRLAYETMKHQNEELEAISNNKTKENQDKVESELKHIKVAHAEMSIQSNDLAEANKKLQKDIQSKDADIEAFNKEIVSLKQQLEGTEIGKREIEEKLEQMETENKLLRQQFSEEKVQLEHTLAELEQNAQNEKQLLDEEISSLRAKLQQITAANESNESAAIQSVQSSMRASIEQMEERIKFVNAELKEKLDENLNLQHQLNESRKEKDDSQTDTANLRTKIDSLKTEKRDLEKTLEKEIRDKAELKTQVTNILQEIGRLEEQLKDVRHSYAEIEKEKMALELKTEQMAKANVDAKNKLEKDTTQKLQSKVKDMEQKLKEIQNENSQLTESNSVLEQSNIRLQTAVAESETNLAILTDKLAEHENLLVTQRIECESLTDSMEKLQDKLSQCLDENSRLFNAKELMEHEYRSLQDQCEAKDKEKLCVLDTNQCLESELTKLRTETDNVQALEREKNNLSTVCDGMRNDLENMQKENSELKSIRDTLQAKCESLSKDLSATEKHRAEVENELKELQNSSTNSVKSLADRCEAMQKEIVELNNRNQMNLDELKETSDEKNQLKEKLKNHSESLKKLESLEQITIENEYLNTSVKHVQSDLDKSNEENARLILDAQDLNTRFNQQQTKIQTLEAEYKKKMETCVVREAEIEQLKSVCQRAQSLNNDLQNEIQQKNQQINGLNMKLEEMSAGIELTESQTQSLNNKITNSEQLNETYQNELRKQKTDNVELQQANQSMTKQLSEVRSELETISGKFTSQEQKLTDLSKELDSSRAIISDLNKDIESQLTELDAIKSIREENVNLKEKLIELEQSSVESTKGAKQNDESESLKRLNESLKLELAQLKQSTDGQISNLQNEIDELLENAKAYKEKSLALEQLNESNNELLKKQVHLQSMAGVDSDSNSIFKIQLERDELDEKLKKIMHEVQDVSNRNLFLEQKCENYLILEQSNERLKSQNDKLSRQLDDTLVSVFLIDLFF